MRIMPIGITDTVVGITTESSLNNPMCSRHLDRQTKTNPDDVEGPRFRPLKHTGKQRHERRHMDPDAIDRMVRKRAEALGLDRGYSAHSMRATFITTALEN